MPSNPRRDYHYCVRTHTFDALNRLSTKAPSGEATATFAYDLHGRKLSSSTPVVSGNPATGTFSFFYDSAGRFYKEETPDSKTTVFVCDNNGNVTKITYPDGYYVSRLYDQINRLTDIKLDGATPSAVHIAYDELSRRQTMTFGNGVSISYTFQLNEDLTGLAETFVGSSVTFTYGFNYVHQEDSREVSDSTYMWHPSAGGTTSYGAANSVNEYPSVGGTSYTYDGNGNLKTNGTWTYTYDTENHLVSASETGTSVSYVYDPDHRQIQKTVRSTNSYYVYSGWQRIADYAGSGTGSLQNRYVYGDRLDEPLIAITSSGTLTYLHADRIGSIIATTNSTGAVTNKNIYSSFGENAPTGTTFGFTGQRYDSETGLYFYKRRYYSPAIGRFLQPDPMGYAGNMNLYTYARNDALNRRDTMGLLDLTYDPWGLLGGGNGSNCDGGSPGDGGDGPYPFLQPYNGDDPIPPQTPGVGPFTGWQYNPVTGDWTEPNLPYINGPQLPYVGGDDPYYEPGQSPYPPTNTDPFGDNPLSGIPGPLPSTPMPISDDPPPTPQPSNPPPYLRDDPFGPPGFLQPAPEPPIA